MSQEPKSAPWEVEQIGRNVHRISFTTKGRQDECWCLLRSDCHHDNPSSLNDLEELHLSQAKERGAAVIDNGDAFCSMQGRWDKRSDKSALKPEHQVDNYLDALVSTYADFLEPYADSLAVMATGNHETSILKHHETNLTTRLCERLRTKTGATLFDGSYTGWVFFSITRGTPKPGNRHPRRTVKLWRTHGYGGGAPVTKGTIQTNRRAVYLPDARVVLSGHTHSEFVLPLQRLRVSNNGKVSQDTQWHIQLPSYKDSFKDGYSYGNWAIEKGMAPQTTGAMWMRLKWDEGYPDGIRVDFHRAD